jgi:COP9 signalosome complex subunit 3
MNLCVISVNNSPIYEIHSAPNLVNSADFLQYAYYGGLLYLGQKRYVDATDFFLMALTAPATSISAIVIEAYKKLVLTSLIAYGKTVTLPKYTSLVVSRHVESHCVGYMEFSSAFHSNDVKKALKVLQMRLDEFKKAGNFGLAKQCLVALQHQKLIQLTRTYASISLEEIAMSIDLETELDVAEKKLLALISTGKIHATIDNVDKKKMVTFVEEEEQFDHDVILHQVHKELVKIMSISDQLRVVDANIVTSNKFVSEIKEKDHRLQHLQQQSGGNAVVPSGPSGLLSSIGSSGQQNGGESGWMED